MDLNNFVFHWNYLLLLYPSVWSDCDTLGPFAIAIHMLRRGKVDTWAWLPERWSCMCVRERKLPINYNKHDHQQYQCIYFAASSAYKFQKKRSSFDIKHKPCWRRHLESTRSASYARTRDCEHLDHNQNDPECNDEWVECWTTNFVIRMIRSIQIAMPNRPYIASCGDGSMSCGIVLWQWSPTWRFWLKSPPTIIEGLHGRELRRFGEKPVGRKTFGRIIFWATDDRATS